MFEFNTFKMVGMISHPSLFQYENKDAENDFNLASNESADFSERVAVLRNYKVDGATETFAVDADYLIDVDADGVYLFKRVN